MLHHESGTVDRDDSKTSFATTSVKFKTAFGDFVLVRGGGVVFVRRADGVVGDAIHFDVLLAMVVAINEHGGVVFVQQWLELIHLHAVNESMSE